ncbi:zinc metallopeptidase [Zhaonella formicivorans]|uniref:zinc metallopeptidase n=1 Tax=Zhaonella formicivorans TaxID=2528593 RepID=UPI0010D6CE90|nr:zinc metallopeptidase [Zhaonella formicivorans]
MFPFFDPTFVLLIPAIILSLYAQAKVQGAFTKYSRVSSTTGLTGAAVARQLLREAGIYDVEVEMIPGHLTDHYDPRHKKLRLSSQVYHSSSLAALGIAAHETGHAIQHDVGYFPLALRNNLAPIAQFGSNLAFPLLFLGLILGAAGLARFGVMAFVAVVLFQLITLPVEFNASNRAIALLEGGGYLTRQEVGPARSVLSAAALTYVAAALTAVLTLLRLFILSGMLRRDE